METGKIQRYEAWRLKGFLGDRAGGGDFKSHNCTRLSSPGAPWVLVRPLHWGPLLAEKPLSSHSISLDLHIFIFKPDGWAGQGGAFRTIYIQTLKTNV